MADMDETMQVTTDMFRVRHQAEPRVSALGTMELLLESAAAVEVAEVQVTEGLAEEDATMVMGAMARARTTRAVPPTTEMMGMRITLTVRRTVWEPTAVLWARGGGEVAAVEEEAGD